MMVGLELVALGCPRFLGFQGTEVGLDPWATLVATITPAAMIGPTVWATGSVHLGEVHLRTAIELGPELGRRSRECRRHAQKNVVLNGPGRLETDHGRQHGRERGRAPPLAFACRSQDHG
jgi:hypothetical protein